MCFELSSIGSDVEVRLELKNRIQTGVSEVHEISRESANLVLFRQLFEYFNAL